MIPPADPLTPFDSSVWFLFTFLCVVDKGFLWLFLFLAMLCMAGSLSVLVMCLFLDHLGWLCADYNRHMWQWQEQQIFFSGFQMKVFYVFNLLESVSWRLQWFWFFFWFHFLISFPDFIFFSSSLFLFQRDSSGLSVAFLFNSCFLAPGSSLVFALFWCLSFLGARGLLTGGGDLFSPWRGHRWCVLPFPLESNQ